MTTRLTEEEFAALRAKIGVGAKTKAEKAARDPHSPRAKRNAWRRVDGSPTEAGEARALADWMRREDIFFLRIPNEGATISRGGFLNILKLTGLAVDAPDFLVMEHPAAIPPTSLPGPHHPPIRTGLLHFCGIAVELKAQAKKHPSGRLEWPEVRDGQKAFLRRFEAAGWLGFVCFGAAEAIRRLEELGIGRSARARRGER